MLGVLAGLLLMVGAYVMTSNRVNSSKEQTLEAKREATEAEAKAKALGSFADFAKIKETRAASVRELAKGRFDWERLVRELALVLPSGTWLTDMDAAVAPGEDQDGQATGTLRATEGGPRATLKGCAKRQPDVANLMVRLRSMHRVEDVGLTESSRSEGDSAAGGVVPSNATNVGGGCGDAYEFELKVAFEPAAATTTGKPGHVPARLGGGS